LPATAIVGIAGIFASARGYGRAGFLLLTAVFLVSSYVIMTATAPAGTDGAGMLWGITLMAYVFGLALMFLFRKRSDAIF
jgi:hypothetical protein